MQPTYIPLSKIFGHQTRFIVPLFQRPYVWHKDSQWEPLWDDVRALTERVLEAGTGQPIAGHFLGTAVLEQTPTQTGTVPCREVIDGQQRLTTLQILLHATRHAIEATLADGEWDEAQAKKLDIGARQIALLTTNSAVGEAEETYKVWPTNDDRLAYREVLDAATQGEAAGKTSLLAQAYRFFFEVERNWISAGDPVKRCEALANALGNHLRLIVLDLDESDEPQAIFETLNAHGTPLLPADLIKNRLLWEAARQELDLTHLHQTYWRPFDADPGFWRASVGTGHAARPRIDIFLQNWLTRRTFDAVPVKHLYARFLRYLQTLGATNEAPPVQQVLADIQADALNYRSLAAPEGQGRFAEFVRRLSRLNIVVFDPLLLAVMRRGDNQPAQLDAIAVTLESYLIRRMVCNSQTRGYGTLALKLLQALEDATPDVAPVTALQAALLEEEGGALGWPDDQQFATYWNGRQFYGSLKRDRVLMLLQAIEEKLQRERRLGEPVLTFDFSKLQIEHIMPQSWEAQWAAPLPPLTREERQIKLHGVGNLTLVSGSLNATLSNAAWTYEPDQTGKSRAGKRDALSAHSQLVLNDRLVSAHSSHWDEGCMQKRAQELFEAAQQIWPPLLVLQSAAPASLLQSRLLTAGAAASAARP